MSIKFIDLTISAPTNTSKFSPILKIAKKFKNIYIKFDLQRYQYEDHIQWFISAFKFEIRI
jgi:hypothetical protein